MLCVGAVGAGVVDGAGGLSMFAGGRGCDAFPAAASSYVQATLDLGHLCFLAVLRDLNLHPHAPHCCSRGGRLATFAAFRALSRLAAWLCFRAGRLFSFWALLALQPPFWRSKKTWLSFLLRSSKIYTSSTFFTLGTGRGTRATAHLTRWEWYWGVNSTQEMSPSSVFWAEMTFCKRLVLERNQQRRNLFRMSKTDRPTSLDASLLGLPLPISVGWWWYKIKKDQVN